MTKTTDRAKTLRKQAKAKRDQAMKLIGEASWLEGAAEKIAEAQDRSKPKAIAVPAPITLDQQRLIRSRKAVATWVATHGDKPFQAIDLHSRFRAAPLIASGEVKLHSKAKGGEKPAAAYYVAVLPEKPVAATNPKPKVVKAKPVVAEDVKPSRTNVAKPMGLGTAVPGDVLPYVTRPRHSGKSMPANYNVVIGGGQREDDDE